MKITPLVHPAAVLKGRAILGPVQETYLKRIVENPEPPLSPNEVPPNCFPDPTLQQLQWFSESVRYLGSPIVLDIENAGPFLICCGMIALRADLTPGWGVCFRFRKKGGAPWWGDENDHLWAVRHLWEVLAAPNVMKIGHFSTQHDLPFLLDLGFEVNGPLLDTSVLCHAVHSELPKGLQFLATLFAGAPRWKDIPDEKEAAPGAVDETEN